jgi:hypothetical protein
MFCFPVATWLGHAAAVLGGRWGAVAQRAQAVGCSREAVYQPSRRVEPAVAREPSRGPCDDEVGAEQPRLRAEHEALGAVWTATEALPEAQHQAWAATGAAMGLRLPQMVTWFGLIRAQCRGPSRATVGRWVAQTQERAGGILAVLAPACEAVVMR